MVLTNRELGWESLARYNGVDPIGRDLSASASGFPIQFIERGHRLLDVGHVLFELRQTVFDVHEAQPNGEGHGARHRRHQPNRSTSVRSEAMNLLAQVSSNVATLAICLLVAAVIMSPFAWRVVKQTLAIEAERKAATHADDADDSAEADQGAEDEVLEPGDIAVILETIDDWGPGSANAKRVTLVVPQEATYRGAPLARNIADQMVTDFIDQAGWQVADRETMSDGTQHWTCVGKP